MTLIENAQYYQTRVLQGLFSAANTEQEKSYRVREFTSALYEEHFSGKNQALYNIIHRYFFLTYALITPHDLIDSIRADDEATEAKVYEYQALLATLRFGDEILTNPQLAKSFPPTKNTYLSDAEFTYAITRLKEQTQIDLFGVSLSDSMQILVNGKTVEKKFLKGFSAAREFYSQQLIDIEHVGGEELPAGTVQDEEEEIKQEYTLAKNGTTRDFSVLTGVRDIDDITGGGIPGEMWFITGFCQPAGELVLTEDGFIPIERLTPGVAIPQQGKVVSTFAFPPKGIIEISASHCPTARFSFDHPIAVMRGGSRLLLWASLLLPGDKVLLPCCPSVSDHYFERETSFYLSEKELPAYASLREAAAEPPSFTENQISYIERTITAVTPLAAEPVYGIETESGWYYAPYLVHNTAEGKTTECINVAYNAIMNGQNVFFGTAETLREQVRRRLICRHSINSKFNSPHGIPGDSLKKGVLTEIEEKLFYTVVKDLVSNPEYGRLKIAQIPKRCTVDYFSALLAKYESEFHIHMAVWDELRLAGVGYKRSSRRE